MVADVQEIISIVKGLGPALGIAVSSDPDHKETPRVEFSGVNIDSIQNETKDKENYLYAITLTVVSDYHGVAELTTIGANLVTYFQDKPMSLQGSTISTQLFNGQRYNSETYIFTAKTQ